MRPPGPQAAHRPTNAASARVRCLARLRIGPWIVLAVLPASLRAEDPPWPLLVEDGFEEGAERWTPGDPEAWRIEPIDRGRVYAQFQASRTEPPHRSPFNISLLKEPAVGDFRLEVEARATARLYDHRDLCIIFGYQDPAHYYYVHFGQKTDDRANQIFIVNGADRRKISDSTTPGTPWDDQWHRLRIVRRTSDGRVEVYFDEMTQPAMTARDSTFGVGRVGLGSFDDTGQWDNFRLWGLIGGKR